MFSLCSTRFERTKPQTRENVLLPLYPLLQIGETQPLAETPLLSPQGENLIFDEKERTFVLS